LLDVGLDRGAAPVDSPLVLEPVDDFPQSQESDFVLSSLLSSVLSHPDVLPDDEELDVDEPDEELLELEELDDEELEELEDELDELEDELLEVDEELGGSVLLLPQLSLLVSGSPLGSLPVDDVLPQPSSATVSSSPVSS
jgi:hypothetical protein